MSEKNRFRTVKYSNFRGNGKFSGVSFCDYIPKNNY